MHCRSLGTDGEFDVWCGWWSCKMNDERIVHDDDSRNAIEKMVLKWRKEQHEMRLS